MAFAKTKKFNGILWRLVISFYVLRLAVLAVSCSLIMVRFIVIALTQNNYFT